MNALVRLPDIESAEFVLPGHPDRLCDALADGIVEAAWRADALAQCGVEAACVFDRVFVTGRIAADERVLRTLDLEAIVRSTFRDAGYGEDAAGFVWVPRPEDLRIDTALCFGPFAPGEREHRHLSDDQAICVGYASPDPGTRHLPPAHWLANRIGRELFRLRREKGAGEAGPDGKVLAQVARDARGWRPHRVSISLNHHEGSDWLLLRRIAEEAVETACAGHGLPALVLNGAGMFIAGGPDGDNGTTGKKLVIDGYGPTVPIGGGAWSGKDPNKVDRLGGFLARELALRIAARHDAETIVELRYEPGCAAPVSIGARCRTAGGAWFPAPVPEDLALANRAVADRFRARFAQPLPELARWGMPGEVALRSTEEPINPRTRITG